MKRIFQWYFDLCRQTDLSFRTAERMRPRIWHKDYVVLKFINSNIVHTLQQYALYNASILDLGASHKPYASLFKAKEYFGVDVSDDTEVDYKADLNKPLNLKRVFDVVVSFDTFEHVLHTNTIIETMSAHVKPDGYAIITTPFLFGVHDAPYDYHRFTEYFYRDFPSDSLEMISIERATTYLSSLVIHQNYIIYRLPIPYFLKFPFYFINNVCALIVEKITRTVARIPVTWLQEFIWSGPLEYFVVLRNTKNKL